MLEAAEKIEAIEVMEAILFPKKDLAAAALDVLLAASVSRSSSSSSSVSALASTLSKPTRSMLTFAFTMDVCGRFRSLKQTPPSHYSTE